MKVPDAVGIPLMVRVLLAKVAATPAGKPVAAPMPVAPVVVWLMLVKAVLIHKFGIEDAVPAVLVGFTVKIPSLYVIE